MYDCPSIDTIQRITATRFTVRVADIKSQRKDAQTVQARHAAMYLCRELTGFSLPVIGRHFGQRDHTTVMYAYKKVADRRARMPEVSRALDALDAEIKAQLATEQKSLTPRRLNEAQRSEALEKLGALLKRREELIQEFDLLNSQIEECGAEIWPPENQEKDDGHARDVPREQLHPEGAPAEPGRDGPALSSP